MIKSDTIIAVKDVEKSSKWYQSLLACKSIHGGSEFDVLVDENNEVIISLHKWSEHEHPTMIDENITAGNGLILYFRTDTMDAIRANADSIDCTIEEDIHLNPNSNKRQFCLRDLDGYYLIISEFHNYLG